MGQDQNQIVSQSKIIIPRGIIDFKKGHSVSIERDSKQLLNHYQFYPPRNDEDKTLMIRNHSFASIDGEEATSRPDFEI